MSKITELNDEITELKDTLDDMEREIRYLRSIQTELTLRNKAFLQDNEKWKRFYEALPDGFTYEACVHAGGCDNEGNEGPTEYEQAWGVKADIARECGLEVRE